MPVVAVSPSQPLITPSAQLNFREMVGELLEWNADYPPQLAQRAIQNAYRRIIDKRQWFGLLVKVQVTVPNILTGGVVSVVNGSTTVTGTGTAFSSALIGRQFRIGYTFPTYTIVNVAGQVLTLDLPWGGITYTAVGYQILQSIVNFGNNCKMVMAVVNQMQGYRLILNMNQQVLNSSDAWRSTTGWTFMLSSYIPSPGNTTVPYGVPQFELYPSPTTAQAFPSLVYTQPPDLLDDEQTPISMVRSDVIVLAALPDALLFDKTSKYYNPVVADLKQKQLVVELGDMMMRDNDCAQKDLIWEFSRYPLYNNLSGQWNQAHDNSFYPGDF